MPPKPITYNDELERLLKENSEECESLSILHRMSYEKYNKRSNYINIPVIILSSAIGFITGIDLQYAQMNIILGVGSVFVGIIKSVEPKSYKIIDQINNDKRECGFVAQDLLTLLSPDMQNLVQEVPDDTYEQIYAVDYGRLTTILWGVCKNLIKRIEILENK